jgi:hypothetical protein
MTMFRRVLTASAIALILASVPSYVAAEESRSSVADRSAVGEWFFSVWSEFAAWFAGEVPTPPAGSGGGATTQGSCGLDPYGCPDHG